MIDSLLNPMNLALTINSYGASAMRPNNDSAGANLHALGLSEEKESKKGAGAGTWTDRPNALSRPREPIWTRRRRGPISVVASSEEIYGKSDLRGRLFLGC